MNISEVFSLVATFSWLLVVIVAGLTVVRASRGQAVKGMITGIIALAVFSLILTTVSAGLVFIQPEERGVVITVFDPGYRSQALQPGLRWVIPFAENVVIYPISKQTYTMSIAASEGQVVGDDSVAARTADGQEIFVDASVIFSIDKQKVIDVHIAWQNRYINDLVRPLARGVIRDVVSQYRVDEVVSTKRFEMATQITDGLTQAIAENGLELVDFVLRNITFSPEYAKSVEQKQIAEQQALQAKFVVESKKQEAEQARQVAQGQADANVIAAQGRAQARLLEAEAEAKALQLIAEVLANNPDLLTYQYITKIAPNVQVMLLPSNSPFLLPLPDLQAPAGPE